MAETARAGWDEAMRGNGSDSAFVRWLTRKPAAGQDDHRPGGGWRAMGVLDPSLPDLNGGRRGVGAAFAGLTFAILCGFYDFRIWTGQATRLTYFIIF